MTRSFDCFLIVCFVFLQSLEDFGDEDDEDLDDRGYEEDNEDDQDYLEDKDERKLAEKKESGTVKPLLSGPSQCPLNRGCLLIKGLQQLCNVC